MSKWHSLLEYLQFPLKVLFFSTLLLGVGSLLSNPNLNLINTATPSLLLSISQIMKFVGAILINIFPLLIFVKILSKKFEDSAPVVIGIFSYVMIMGIVIILAKTDFPAYFYENMFGVKISSDTISSISNAIQSPYKLGIFPFIIAYFITSYSYQRSRHHIRHGLFYFIDHDSWAMLITTILSAVAGIGICILWPYVMEAITQFFAYISTDINNPLHLFFYGIFERICGILNLIDIPRNVFWLTDAGGSWIDSVGNTYLGDVSIWQAILKTNDVNTTSGQFVSAYYIINLFLIPAFLLAYYTLMGKKKNRMKYLIFIILACLLSIFCGNPLPIELCMLIISPLLYVCYLFMVGFAFALTTSIDALIGFSYGGTVLTALPGNIVDLIAYLNYVDFYQSVLTIVVIGLVLGVLFYFATLFYFKKAAIGLLSINDAQKVAQMVVKAMGGRDNIIDIDATPDKLIASFKSRDLVDLDALHELGAYLILESRDGYYIRLGNISIMVFDKIKQMMLDHKQGKSLT